MTLGLGTLKQGLEGGPCATSSTSFQGVESDESLRLRLGKMQSKWLQDVSELKVSDVQDPKVPENALKKLRGTNSWLLQLMREASDAEFLPPPWRPKTGPGGDTEAAEELPAQID